MKTRSKIIGVTSAPSELSLSERKRSQTKVWKKGLKSMWRKRVRGLLKTIRQPGTQYWKQHQVQFAATASINVARPVIKIFKSNPNSAIFAVGRKGLMAERLVRTACWQLGQKLPQAVCMKAKPGTRRTTESFLFGNILLQGNKGKEYELAFDKGSSALAEYIRASPAYGSLKNKENIVIIEDFSNQKSQSYYFKSALEKAFPNSKVHLFILLEKSPERGFPEAVEPHGARETIVARNQLSGEVEEYQFNLSQVLNDSYWRAYFKDVQAEIKLQLKKPHP
ncbi:MAG: hypothetical protein WC821_03930 [archaeon]|jgi:hypothetical protein